MNKLNLIAGIVLFFSLISCSENTRIPTGKLFIIGGGEKTDSMMNELVNLSGIRTNGYMFILPMASSVPDSSLIWTREDFRGTGINKMPGFNFKTGETASAQLDSLKNAKLVFISGGDQGRFMDVVRNAPVMEAIFYAWNHGAVIAGTSAGAAVMSKKMITGNQLKHPGLESRYPTIESGNIEIKEGLGLLKNAIIDQHFVKRQRLNRLIAVSIENSEELCVGIDESTAIVVGGDIAKVTGVGQVVVIRNKEKKKSVRNELLGTENIEISVYLPGDKFRLR